MISDTILSAAEIGISFQILWFVKTPDDFEINDIAALPSLFLL
jgi:hypothetical protein